MASRCFRCDLPLDCAAWQGQQQTIRGSAGVTTKPLDLCGLSGSLLYLDNPRVVRRVGSLHRGGNQSGAIDLGVDRASALEPRTQPGLPRKEVIQPHVPVRLPCYDFVPIADSALGSCPLAVGSPTSGVSNFHDVTGGVYKARERIHRSVLTCGY